MYSKIFTIMGVWILFVGVGLICCGDLPMLSKIEKIGYTLIWVGLAIFIWALTIIVLFQP